MHGPGDLAGAHACSGPQTGGPIARSLLASDGSDSEYVTVSRHTPYTLSLS